MIHTSELRRGNWVNATYDGIDYRRVYSIPNMDEFAAEPISITPEILEKAGFHDSCLLLGDKGVCSLGWYLKSCTYKNETTVSLCYDYDDCAYASHNAEYGKTEFIHLHQLQNLYFALTCEELAIEL